MINTIPADEYHASADLSASLIKVLLAETPRRAWLESALNPNRVFDDSGSMNIGTAAHDLFLEGGTGKIVVINPEEHRSKPSKKNPEGNIPKGWTNDAIKEARDNAIESGKLPMLPVEYQQVQQMAKRANEKLAQEGLQLADFKAEQSIYWTERGVACRGRLDLLANDYGMVLDYKTTSARSPEEWIRKYITSMGHDIQEDFYSRAIEAETGIRPRFLFLVQQDFGEFDCFPLIALSATKKEIARVKVDKALNIWQACVEAQNWPSWPSGVMEAEASNWELTEAEEISLELEYWDKDAKGAKEVFLFGKVAPKEEYHG